MGVVERHEVEMWGVVWGWGGEGWGCGVGGLVNENKILGNI